MIGGLGACSSTPERVDASIDAVYGQPKSRVLEVSVYACNADPRVSLTETDHEVRLHVTVDQGPYDDCAVVAKATLDRPLGNRVVIANDRTMLVTPGD